MDAKLCLCHSGEMVVFRASHFNDVSDIFAHRTVPDFKSSTDQSGRFFEIRITITIKKCEEIETKNLEFSTGFEQ